MELKTLDNRSELNDVATNLKRITVHKYNKYFKSSDGVLYNYDMIKLYAYPNAKKGSFKIPDGVQSINPDPFSGAKYITRLMLPSSLKSVAIYVAGCVSLKKITFKEGIKTVYLYVGTEPDETFYYTGFKGGINIKNIYFPSAFYNITIDGINKTASIFGLLAVLAYGRNLCICIYNYFTACGVFYYYHIWRGIYFFPVTIPASVHILH